jgi:hypothetical protein
MAGLLAKDARFDRERNLRISFQVIARGKPLYLLWIPACAGMTKKVEGSFHTRKKN